MVATEAVGFAFLATGVGLLFLLREPIHHPEKPGSRGFLLAVIGVALWPLSLGINYFVADPVLSIALWNVRLFAASLISVGWFLLAVDVTTGRWLPRRLLLPLGGYLAVDQLLAWTNSAHHLVLGPGTVLEGTVLSTELGPWFWAQTAVNYGLILGGTALLVAEWVRSSGLRRRQTAVLSLAVVPPVAANLVTIFDAVTVTHDLTPFGLVGSGILLSWALYRAAFLDVVPVAREVAMADMRDAVVTLDDQDRVVDCNRAARTLFDVPDDYVGLSAVRFLDPLSAEDVRRIADADQLDTDIVTTLDGQRCHLSVSVSRVDQHNVTGGRVIVVRDITPLEVRERTLEAREAELDLLRQILSRVLRHNVRNKLTTIHGNAQILADSADDPADRERAAAIIGASEELIDASEKTQEIERLVDRTDVTATYDLRRVAERAVESVRSEYPGVSFGVDGPESLSLTAGPGVESAVVALVENAAAYNDGDDPRVRVSVGRGADVASDGGPDGDGSRADRSDETRGGAVEGAALTVSDNGPGIPEDELTVLERGAETPLFHSTGVGLWLVKWTAERSGADLSFETGEDGTTVSLRFESAAGETGVV